MWWIILVLGLACLVLIFVHIVAWKQLKSLSRQLLAMREKPFDNMILRVDEGSRKFDDMVIKMNAMLDTMRNSNRKLLHQKQAFKTQISSMSHDLRTPLTSIMGYIELAKEEQDPDKRNEYLEIIRKRSRILQTLIVDFYDLSRLEDEEYQLHKEKLLIDTLLEDTILTFYHDFEKKALI